MEWPNIGKWLQNGKGVKVAVALGLIGMVLILVSEWLPSGEGKVDTSPVKTTEQYRAETEQHLKELLSHMEGVGQCRIFVTFESGVEYVYATEQKGNSDYSENKNDSSEQVSQKENTEESIILIDGDNGKTGLLRTEIQPQVKGVVVVCEGGGNAAVAERIVSAITTALNISSRRVCVTK